MDSVDSKDDGYNTRRRSGRQASKTGLSGADLRRSSLKRTRKMREDHAETSSVNGSKKSKILGKHDNNNDEDDDDDDSPDKKQKLKEAKKEGDINEGGDGLNLTDVEMDEDEDQDQRMSSDEPRIQEEKHPACIQGERPNQNLEKKTIVVRRIPIQIPESKPILVRQMSIQKTEGHEKLRPKMENNRLKTTTQDALHRGSWNSWPSSQNQNSFIYQKIHHPITNQTARHKNREMKNLAEPVTSKASPVSSSKGGVWCTCKRFALIPLILIGLLALSFLAYQKLLFSHLPQTDVIPSEALDKFDMKVAELQALFPSQRSVLWKRTGKHLKRHLKTVEHTEPVSMILTAGHQAERTLGCLARSLATVYSAVHNASIIEINGTTKRAQDSDQVKLEVDEALRKAFEGDKPAAVVHHFEELPPGSTLIFYRYCDHENAAYKNVFLVFTVMLSVNEIKVKESLSAVEDMVHDHVTEKFISSEKSAVFNQMDVDKLSGLWSRISHLILPVVAEEKFEQHGCEA